MEDTFGNAQTVGRVPRGFLSAIFDGKRQAQDAVRDLRSLDIPDTAMSVITHQGDGSEQEAENYGEWEEGPDVGEGALTGAGVGAATGALFGLAAAVIPGVGPFITAGALASILGVTAGAAASGAIVGGSAGALAGAISRLGVSGEESDYYAKEVAQGGVYLGVDLSQSIAERADVEEVLRRNGGRTYA